jgi:hypothetical protein
MRVKRTSVPERNARIEHPDLFIFKEEGVVPRSGLQGVKRIELLGRHEPAYVTQLFLVIGDGDDWKSLAELIVNANQ